MDELNRLPAKHASRWANTCLEDDTHTYTCIHDVVHSNDADFVQIQKCQVFDVGLCVYGT